MIIEADLSTMKVNAYVLLMSSLVLPALAGFGKTPDLALKSVPGKRRRWSSTGMEGLHEQFVIDKATEAKTFRTFQEAREPSHKESSHPFEHHPFASGSFTIDPVEV